MYLEIDTNPILGQEKYVHSDTKYYQSRSGLRVLLEYTMNAKTLSGVRVSRYWEGDSYQPI